MSLKFIIVDQMHESLFPMLEKIKVSYDYFPEYKREDIKKAIPGYDGLIIRSKTKVDHELIEGAVNLKVVCRAGAGIDNLDEEALHKQGIHIINAPEGNRDAVAEHTIGLLLNLFAKINQADNQVRDRIWDREGNRGIELKNKTVGIIGYGNMGSAVAERLRSFGCDILVYDKYKRSFKDNFVQSVTLEDLFASTDVLSLHIPLTTETRGWIDKDFFSKFKKDIFLINTSRGEIIPLKDLVSLLKSGKIRGAGLDVLENERINELSEEQNRNFNYLIASDNVVLTPHVAGWSAESYQKINEVLVNKLILWMK